MNITRTIHTIDASGMPLGRLAVLIASHLMGKRKTSFVRRADAGDGVAIVNWKQIKFTGNKLKTKLYYRPTKRPGALKSENLEKFWRRRPAEVIRRAVWGMLPKNSLRKTMIQRLILKH